LGFVLFVFELVVFLAGALATFFEEAAVGFLATSATLLRSVMAK
jgi:hypothetical protein